MRSGYIEPIAAIAISLLVLGVTLALASEEPVLRWAAAACGGLLVVLAVTLFLLDRYDRRRID